MRYPFAFLLALAAIAPLEARLITVNTVSVEVDPTPGDGTCDLSSEDNLQCTFLGALSQPLANPGDIDTIAFRRMGDTSRTLTFFDLMVDVDKPVRLIDSTYQATGAVRLRFEGLSLRFNASPVSIQGFSFTRAGTGRSHIALFGNGPDRLVGNWFNLAPGDSATGGNYSMLGVLVGARNNKTDISSNRFGTYGTFFSGGLALRVYGDSTQIVRNHFGMTNAGLPVLFNASAIVVSSFRASGVGGESDTLYAPVGGTVMANKIATCSEKAQGIGLAGSAGEGGTRGWSVSFNDLGVDPDDRSKPLAGCSPSTDEAMSGIALISTTAQDQVFGNRVDGNLIHVAPNGIVLRGPGTNGNDIVHNEIGVPETPGTGPFIAHNGVLIHGGAHANRIDSNIVGGSASGIRLGWGTGWGNGLDNTIRGNLVGAASKEFTIANDSGIVLDYTSKGNVVERNIVIGNRHHGIVFASPYLEPNRIEDNRIGVDRSGSRSPNGRAALRSVAGAGGQVVKRNLFGSSGSWAVEVSLSTVRPTVLDSNRFLGGQDSGAILFQGSDSLRMTGNVFDSCTRACVELRGGRNGRIVGNRFAGRSPALVAKSHPTQSWLVTSARLEDNALPAIPVPVDLVGTLGYTPNDPLDADAGPMGLLNHPRLRSATRQGDSLVLTYDLDLANTTASPVLRLYAGLPDSGVLLPLGSSPVVVGTGNRLALLAARTLPSGTLLRAGLVDAAGNSSELDSGVVFSGTTSVRDRHLASNARPAAGALMLDLASASVVRWSVHGLDGRLLGSAEQHFGAGRHLVRLPARREPTILRLDVGGELSVHRLPPNLGR